MSRTRDQEWLKARTLHIKGIPQEDRSGEGLRTILDTFLQECDGNVIDIQIVPPFSKILSIEAKMREMKDLNMLLIAESDTRHCCIPRRYRDVELLEQKMEKYEEKLLEETMKPYVPSGHAFVCFDSVNSVNACLKHFRLTPVRACSFFAGQIKDNCKGCCGLASTYDEWNRKRARSTFFNRDDIEAEEVVERYKEVVLVVQKAQEPTDILWTNMSGARGLFLLRRIFLFLLGLCLILFVSSPTVLFTNLKAVDQTDFFELTWTQYLPLGTGEFVRTHLPPMMIICINQVLLILIDISCHLEKHTTHSEYQVAVYTKCTIYLFLNMMVIPALTLTSSNDEKNPFSGSLWQFLVDKNFNVTRVLGEFYVGNNGQFFVSLIIQQACFSSAYYLLNLSDIVFSYFSSRLAYMQRQVYQDQEPWLRYPENTFQYGYFYSQMITVFGICIFFSSTVPLLSVVTAFYAAIRHGVDCLNLITVFRKEIDSQGSLIDKATTTALIFVLGYQLCMMSFFTINEHTEEAVVCTFIFILSVFYIVISYESVNDQSLLDQEEMRFKMDNETELNAVLEKWRGEFDHPSVVSKNKRAQVDDIRNEMKEIDKWEDYWRNSNIRSLFEASSSFPRDSGLLSFSQVANPQNLSPNQQRRWSIAMKRQNFKRSVLENPRSSSQAMELREMPEQKLIVDEDIPSDKLLHQSPELKGSRKQLGAIDEIRESEENQQLSSLRLSQPASSQQY